MDKDFKPYVSEDRKMPEFTPVSVVTGVILAVVFGAANAYLGLRVGMTVSASIPAAVISMFIIRKVLKKNSILENNMVQTIGSAGESIAGGAVFTFPALFLWAQEGVMDTPGVIQLTIIAIIGGLLGVLFMVPLRKSLIVDEHGKLPFPEGKACAEVLLAAEDDKTSSRPVFVGMLFAAVIKFITDGLKNVAGIITIPIRALKTEFSVQMYPALVGVGYICGAKIASYMLAGGIIGWFVLIPMIVLFGNDTILYPGTESIRVIYETEGASGIWSNYIRYIGAGAVAASGLISLVRLVPSIVKNFAEALKGMKRSDSKKKDVSRTSDNISTRTIMLGIALLIILIGLLPIVPISFGGALLVAFMGFFFGAVSSRMVGLVGSSNNPVSGMTIATLLVATSVLKFTGHSGTVGMISAIAIGSIVCIITAISSDTAQDLKTGYLLGATPKKQQIGEMIGVAVSSLAIGGVMILLNKAWGFGSNELAAPQATLMKMIVEGIMGGNLPWGLIFIGAFITIAMEIFRVPTLAIAIGMYLPIEISTTIMIGGVVRYFADRKNTGESSDGDSGILFCSGMIAGEGLVGVLLALFAVVGIDSYLDISGFFDTGLIGGLLVLVAIIAVLAKYAFTAGDRKNNSI